MKRKSIYRILAVLFTATIFFAACTKEDKEVKLAPKLSTAQLLSVTSESATVVGYVIAQGDGFTERGVCYNTATLPTVANSKAIYTGETTGATFNVAMSGLTFATKYYVRAYAIDANGQTYYGEEFNFVTLPVVPTMETAAITEITGNTASGGGMVMVNGGAPITVQGVCYSLKSEPTIADSKTADGNATGPYISSLTNLKGNNTYYVRAYATNSAGTGYGPIVTFRTEVDVPSVTTKAVTGITATGASSGGDIPFNGGAAITGKGVCWSTSANPTIADSKTSNGTGEATFTSALTGLSIATLYHVRAYAINSAGVGYGNDVTFLTFPPAIYALGDGTAAGWDNTKAVKVNQSSTAGVYVETLTLTAVKSMKFILTLGAWQPQWGQATGQPLGTLGVNMGGGSDPDAITTPATDGNYKVTVDLGKMTYKIETAFPAALYMVGDGVVSSAGNEWNWTIDLPMVPVNGTPNMFWKIVWMNATGGFKMAPEKAWGNDFGKTGSATVGADGSVYAKGGDNIPVPGVAGYYMVVVNLATNKIAIADAKVYLMGSVYDPTWTSANPAGLFTVDNANSVLTITKTLNAAELRMYAAHTWFPTGDWWRTEFIILNNLIAFRGNGGDQTRVAVTAGDHKIDLNFKTGAGAIN